MSFDVERAVRLNNQYMLPKKEGWQTHFDRIAELLGFTDRSPSEWEFAEAVFRWQKVQQPPLIPDGIIGPATWTRMRRALGLRQPAPTQPGPQSFAPANPGTTPLDLNLVTRNRLIEQEMLRAADSYYDQNDFRWFFAYAHGQITKQINQNVMRFQRPDALLRLNIHFAEEFLRAVGGQPHEGWRRAFRACQVLQDNASTNILLAGEVEFCGAAMANVHIRMDLSAALLEVGCIPPEDYGNMLIFVNRGSLAALVRLRGRSVGAAEAILQQLVAPLVELEVKAWRNTVYQDACNTPVPDPVPNFLSPR